MKSLFYSLGSVLFLFLLASIIFYQPPIGDTVTASKLSRAAELAAEYPDQAVSYLPKIRSATLTNGEFALLEQGVKPAQERKEAAAVEQRRTESPMAYWLLDRYMGALLVFVIIAATALVKLFGLRNAEPGERTFCGIQL